MSLARGFAIAAAVVCLCTSMLLLRPQHSIAGPARGPHGGELRNATGIPESASIELVIKSSAQGKEIHVYGIDSQNRSINLKASGFGGIVFKMADLELPLLCMKVDDRGYITNANDAVEHYSAVGKFPSSVQVRLEVTIAFPGKRGTGKATFHPFGNPEESWY